MAEQRGMIGQFEPEWEDHVTLKFSNSMTLHRM
jgi:hypothetical protein